MIGGASESGTGRSARCNRVGEKSFATVRCHSRSVSVKPVGRVGLSRMLCQAVTRLGYAAGPSLRIIPNGGRANDGTFVEAIALVRVVGQTKAGPLARRPDLGTSSRGQSQSVSRRRVDRLPADHTATGFACLKASRYRKPSPGRSDMTTRCRSGPFKVESHSSARSLTSPAFDLSK